MDYDDAPVVPFVSLKSRGGAFDDDGFTAGFEMGNLWCTLGLCAGQQALPPRTMIRQANEHQADLLAMHHGYTMTKVGVTEDGYWCDVVFQIAEGVPGA